MATKSTKKKVPDLTDALLAVVKAKSFSDGCGIEEMFKEVVSNDNDEDMDDVYLGKFEDYAKQMIAEGKAGEVIRVIEDIINGCFC